MSYFSFNRDFLFFVGFLVLDEEKQMCLKLIFLPSGNKSQIIIYAILMVDI